MATGVGRPRSHSSETGACPGRALRVTELLLRLFVSGNSTSSRRAKENLARLQETSLPAGWRVEIVDVLTAPELAEKARILATPTLSYDLPSRPKRIVGDLSDTAKVMEFLGIEFRDKQP